MTISPVKWPHPFPPSTDTWTYDCGWCGTRVSSVKGSFSRWTSGGGVTGPIRFCPNCGRPSYAGGDTTTPAQPYGRDVAALPEKVSGLYREARDSIGASAPHAAVMACRKLLMHVAVENGAVAMMLQIVYEFPERGRQSVAARKAKDQGSGSPVEALIAR